MIDKEILKIEENTCKDTNEFFHSKKDGSSFYDEEGNKKIYISLENTIFDGAVLVHELTHYRNQPNGKRGFVNDLLTEALSYGVELIFFEDLKDTNYKHDRNLHFMLLVKIMYNYVYNIYYIYKIILLYKKEKNIGKELYDKMFSDGEYQYMLNQFEKYVSRKGSILRDTWNIIGFPLAIYMLEEYRRDKKFFILMEQFNEAIKKESLEDCLKVLNINSKEDFADKIMGSSNSFIKLLKKLN